MENTKKLNRWFLDHHKELELKVTQLGWVKEWLPGYYDLQVSITNGGRQFIGRSVDKNVDLAFVKAGSEATERSICFENALQSAGIAVHTEEEKTKQNAKWELIERDRFFCHYLTQSPFTKTDCTLTEIDFYRIKEKLKNKSIEFLIREMRPINHVRSAICLSKGQETGLILGLGASEDIQAAAKKAVLECLLNTVAAIERPVSLLDINSFHSMRNPQPEDHRRLYFAESKLIQENMWMMEDCDSFLAPELTNEESFQFKKLNSQSTVLSECPIIAVQCKNPHFQSSYFGALRKGCVNIDQLEKFSGDDITFCDLSQAPHPLG